MGAKSIAAKEVFLDALDLDEIERDEFLRASCGGDEALRAQVDQLLDAHRKSDTVFGAVHIPSTQIDRLKEGAVIGPYVLVEEIGEGGFAVVWRARQTRPVDRMVALKVLKAGMDTREVVARFEAERQALALMDHPCISKVFDGGATDAGRPWFAMELVDGEPITDFCDARGMGKDDRLRLFQSVCRAVQHAHQKGVIHRDIKPSNVLVGVVDGVATPKVIDFGIAKAIERKLSDQSIRTLDGQLIGTPAYMSPEQVVDSADVDTRCDVYALGVLLYELLSGRKPFEDETLRAADLAEVLRMIREVDPPRPSTRIGPRTHIQSKDLRGDLDWIVMRCLEKDRERRYDSADVLAREIELHLAGEPVLAGPPELAYRMRKFVHRHRISLGVSAGVVGLLVVGVVVSLSLMVRAQGAERDLGIEAVRRETELAKYQGISTFFEQVLMGVDPAYAQGKDTELLKRVLDRAAANIEEESGGVPEVEATIRRVIGGAYRSLARDEDAEEQLSLALAIRTRVLDADDPDLFEIQSDLGAFYLDIGRVNEAEPLLEDALTGRRRVLPADHDDVLASTLNFAVLRMKQERPAEAEPMLLEVEAARLERFGEEHPDTIRAMNNVASALKNQGRLEEAAERYERASELQLEVQGRRHPETLKAMTNLGMILMDLGRSSDAIHYLEFALELKREVLPDGSPSLLVSMNSLAKLHQDGGRLDAAEQMFEDAREMIDRTDTVGTPNALMLSYNYAVFLDDVGRGPAAEEEYRRLATAAESSMGRTASLTLTLDSALAWQMHKNGKSEEAEPVARDVCQRAEENTPAGHPTIGMHRIRHGIVLIATGKRDEGVERIRAGLPIVRGAGITNWVERGETALVEAGASIEE